MSRTPIDSESFHIEEGARKERLRQLAYKLDAELIAGAKQSRLICDLSKFPPLADAICRAKKLAIEQAEQVQGVGYWYLHTDLQAVIGLVPTLSEFLFALERWEPESGEQSRE